MQVVTLVIFDTPKVPLKLGNFYVECFLTRRAGSDLIALISTHPLLTPL
jgi:hypothetical protein